MKKLMMLVLAGLFSAGMAFANEGDKVNFDELDQDGDGQLSRTEVAQDSELAAQFSTLDADGDGYLAQTEVKDASMEDASAEDEPVEETGEDY
ncbi:MAG: EF-hand domain-containing protein [Proteobacteria bacterium]|nr:EF-hand domain-containing protein [Pseudomonadota bacterium]